MIKEDAYPVLYEGKEPYIFISYSHDSKDKVYEILNRMNLNGIRVWYDKGLEKGVDWEKYVEVKMKEASMVFFFFDINFFSSDSLLREVKLVRENNIKYCPIYYEGKLCQQIYRSIPEDIIVDEEKVDILIKSFNSKITSIIFKNNDLFYKEIVEEAVKQNSISKELEQVALEKPHKFVFIAKDSLFSHSIAEGIVSEFSKSNHSLDIKYINDLNAPMDICCNNALNEVLNGNFDGLILRPLGKMNERTFSLFKEICKKIKVVICDNSLTVEQQKLLGEFNPTFVCSDFKLGGEKIATIIKQIAFSFGTYLTDIYIAIGPSKNVPGTIRSEAIVNKLSIDGMQNVLTIPLNSLEPVDSFQRINNYFINKQLNNVFEKCLILYAGNDNIALYLAKNLDKIRTNIPLTAYKKIVIIGYDGIIGTTKNSILEESNYDYITVDTLPFNQGSVCARRILKEINGLNKKENVMVTPKVIKKLNLDPLQLNKIDSINGLLKNAKCFVFDLDGTIADTETLHWEAYNLLLKEEYNISLSEENIKRYIGNNEISIYRMIEHDYDITIDDEHFLKTRLEIYLKLIEEKNLQPYKWVNYFKQNYSDKKVILLTSQKPMIVNTLLNLWNLDDLILKRRRISTHDGKITKKEVFENLYKYVDVNREDISDIVVFEDSEHVAKMAYQLGYTVIGIKHMYNQNTLKSCVCTVDEKIKKGLFVGLAGLDLVFNVNKMPNKDDKVKTSEYYLSVGGPALKAAITCVKLGGDATLIAGIGSSQISNIIRQCCDTYHIKLIDLMPTKAIPNISFVAINKNDSTRDIVSGQTISSNILNIPDSYYKQFDYCLYDCNFPFFTKELVENLENADIPLILDCGSWKDNISYALEYASYAISSNNFKSTKGEDIFALKDIYNIPFVAKTRGKESILAKCDKEIIEINVQAKEHVSTLGAGDVFHGAFCYYKFNLEEDFIKSLEDASQIATKYVK